MFNFHKSHKNLVIAAFLGFGFLSTIIAIAPANEMQKAQPLPDQPELTAREIRGLEVFVSENCMSCHTQQVRNIAMDEVWGERPSIPSDYYYSKKRLDIWRQSPSLLGSERTGPDLTNVGNRKPGQTWHLLHLYNPRIVEEASIMPSYPWMFEEKDSLSVTEEDVVLPVPAEFLEDESKKIVATEKMLDLVAYLQTLKQTPLPGTMNSEFIPAANKKDGKTASSDVAMGEEGAMIDVFPDGEKLYMQHCGACHQSEGNGLVGAFPPIAGSSIVLDDDPDLMIRIILQGYDARSEFSIMPGFASQLSDEEITAIANHERTSWGNDAREITVEEVKKIREFVMNDL